MAKRIKVLITVKTYPLPSKNYEELVCTAGIREDGTFIRLYPIDYRYRPYTQWYSKYQWIEANVEKNTNDPRPESFRPLGDIKILGEPLGTAENWKERKKYILANEIPTMCDLESCPQTEVSVGIIRPKEVTDFIIEETEREWKAQWIAQMRQLNLFGPEKKPLEKIPYKFSYKFICEHPKCKGHKKMIEDWELGELYRRMRNKFQDEEIACKKVKEKYYGDICDPKIDTHFFVGTVLQHGSWIILGTFWPKKEKPQAQQKSEQKSLFD